MTATVVQDKPPRWLMYSSDGGEWAHLSGSSPTPKQPKTPPRRASVPLSAPGLKLPCHSSPSPIVHLPRTFLAGSPPTPKVQLFFVARCKRLRRPLQCRAVPHSSIYLRPFVTRLSLLHFSFPSCRQCASSSDGRLSHAPTRRPCPELHRRVRLDTVSHLAGQSFWTRGRYELGYSIDCQELWIFTTPWPSQAGHHHGES